MDIDEGIENYLEILRGIEHSLRSGMSIKYNSQESRDATAIQQYFFSKGLHKQFETLLYKKTNGCYGEDHGGPYG